VLDAVPRVLVLVFHGGKAVSNPKRPVHASPAGTAPTECPKRAAAVDEILARLDGPVINRAPYTFTPEMREMSLPKFVKHIVRSAERGK